MLTIPDFSNSTILVFGDVMLDRYWHGNTTRISPEAPVPIVHIETTKELPGGAGNVALNINGLGAQAILVSSTGDDVPADLLQGALTSSNIQTHLVRDAKRPTVTKLRIISHQQQLIRLDFENLLSPCNQDLLLQHYQAALPKANVVILSDYHKGTIQDPQPFIQAAKRLGKPVLIDPKGEDFAPYRGATLIKPNRKEFERVVGVCKTDSELIAKGIQAIKTYDLEALLITCGEKGMILLQRDLPPMQLPAKAQEVFDVTGAGDTVIAVLAASMAAGCSLSVSVQLANYAASIAVSKLGAATVQVAELRRLLHQEQGNESGIKTQEQLRLLIEDAKAHGETIVMTNGCFDILHAGHVTYLNQAKALGHRLLVAVNDDASVKALKGDFRPINPLTKRMFVLAGLAAVDWVVPFSEATPLRLIELLGPDVLVKGGDYTKDAVVGRESVEARGGKVVILPFQEGCSTTAVINSILETEGEV